jgi:hypothetical protein
VAFFDYGCLANDFVNLVDAIKVSLALTVESFQLTIYLFGFDLESLSMLYLTRF